MDSIIRQSRHQYGVDKDLFAARFCKNICTTFQSLYKCPEEDRVCSGLGLRVVLLLLMDHLEFGTKAYLDWIGQWDLE